MSRRILYAIGQLDRGGAERQLYHLLEQQSTPATVLVLSTGGYWADPIRKLGHEVIELPRAGRFDVKRLRETMTIVSRLEPDILHIFLDGIAALYPRVAGYLLRHPAVVVGVRVSPLYYPRWFNTATRVLNSNVRAFICNSKHALEGLREKRVAPDERLFYIPNSIDISRFPSPAERHANGGVIIGAVTHLTAVKNPTLLIDAFSKVHAAAPQTELRIVGEGPLRPDCESLIKSRDLEGAVQLLGERDDVPQLLQQFDIFTLSSNSEGTPNAVLEAMASGLPAVVTRAGDAGVIVEDLEAGYSVAPGDADGMAQSLLGLVNDPEARRKLGASGRHGAETLLNPKRIAEQYEAVYDHVLRR